MTVNFLYCFGYGYTAAALARHVSMAKRNIVGTQRAPETKTDPANPAVELTAFPAPGFAPKPGAAWLISVPPDDEGCPVYRQLADYCDSATWIGYLSSTGVYGDLGGGWAFEDTPVKPLSTEAKRRSIAEDQWRAKGAHVFRLPGIYGPGRSAFDKLRKGVSRSIDKPGQVFSRAHVDDIADLLARSVIRPNPGRVYNMADDKPCPPQEVVAHAASLLGVSAPPLVRIEDANLPLKAQRFYAECKRVPNARAKSELGWLPRYPTYREGLAAILQAETDRSG